MQQQRLSAWLREKPLILTEFGVNERIRRHPVMREDPFVGNAPMVLDEAGREMLSYIYLEYLHIAAEAGLPLVLEAPTWRVNRPRAEKAGLDPEHLTREAISLLRGLAAQVPEVTVLLAGLLSTYGDAYLPEEALPEEEAFRFHGEQAASLVRAGADFLLPATLPALVEARGLARACEASGAEYVIGFVIDDLGRLLDGTALPVAMAQVRQAVQRQPEGFMICCAHPGKVARALDIHGPLPGLLGLQANASALSPEELDNRDEVDEGDPEDFARICAQLHRRDGLRLLGGCCGTDGRHMRALTRTLGRSL